MKNSAPSIRDRANALKKIFTAPLFVVVAALAAAAYYVLFFYVMNYGMGAVLPNATSVYPVYVLIASSAVLVSLGAYELAKSLGVVGAGEAEAVSVCTASFGFMIAGCGCYAPVVSSLLYLMGMGAVQVSGVISLLGNYQEWLIFLLIIINLAFIYYQSGRIARRARASKRR
jgi:hypothetical protein